MTHRARLLFVDPKHGRGGGQVVLEGLLRRCSGQGDVALAMPDDGREAISVPDDVETFPTIDEATRGLVRGDALRMVANANSAFPRVVLSARRLRARGIHVETVAIVHNYPTDIAKRVATTRSLALFDKAVVVEPGLLELRRDAIVPPWLSLTSEFEFFSGTVTGLSGSIKSYGRPDPSKGLHLLPPLFAAAERLGLRPEVALGQALDGKERYRRRLQRELAPWLVDGRRTSNWIQPGDIFVIPSVGGEAACLTAQEALARGAFVVASRVGLMPYLLAGEGAMWTFVPGAADDGIRAVEEIVHLTSDSVTAAVRAGSAQIRARTDLWYRHVTRLLVDFPRLDTLS
ncbi:hypothetical protein GCM10028801_11820 [Nocardioides maradonensis]